MTEVLRKYVVLPVILLGLAAAFVVLCALVVINRGNDRLLRRKLRIGGLILALQAVGTQGAWPAASCYERVTPEVTVSTSASETGLIELNLKESSRITATVKYGARLRFSYAVIGQGAVIASGAVDPVDGRMDSGEETVAILMDPNALSTGTYELRIFQVAPMQPKYLLRMTPIRTYRLAVRNE